VTGTNSATFYYKDDTVGTPTITAHLSSGTPTLSDGTQTETVRATQAIAVSSSTNWSAITGGPPLMGDTVTISNSATVTVDRVGEAAYSVTLAGSTSNGNNGTLAFNANTSLTIFNLTVGTGHGNGSIIMSAGGQFTILGTVTVTSAGTWTPGSGTVVHGASGAQTINATFFTSYCNLIFSGSGAKSMVTGTSVTGNLSIAPTGNATASLGCWPYPQREYPHAWWCVADRSWDLGRHWFWCYSYSYYLLRRDNRQVDGGSLIGG
jgi:hypothetical protein